MKILVTLLACLLLWVTPVAAGGIQVWTQLNPLDGHRLDFVLVDEGMLQGGAGILWDGRNEGIHLLLRLVAIDSEHLEVGVEQRFIWHPTFTPYVQLKHKHLAVMVNKDMVWVGIVIPF